METNMEIQTMGYSPASVTCFCNKPLACTKQTHASRAFACILLLQIRSVLSPATLTPPRQKISQILLQVLLNLKIPKWFICTLEFAKHWSRWLETEILVTGRSCLDCDSTSQVQKDFFTYWRNWAWTSSWLLNANFIWCDKETYQRFQQRSI